MSLSSRKYLSESELETLESALWNGNITERNRLLLLLAIHTGARASELLSLTVASFNIATGSLLIQGLKGSNDREIPLPDPLAGLLRSYVASLGDLGPTGPLDLSTVRLFPIASGSSRSSNDSSSRRLFDISYKRLFQIWHCHRTVAKSFHSLRHSMGVRLYKRTKDIHLVKYVLGHKSITNTMIYLDYCRSQEELRKVLL